MANERSGLLHASRADSVSWEPDRTAKDDIESKGVAAFSEATANFEDVVADAAAPGQVVLDSAFQKPPEAIHNVRGVGDAAAGAIEKSVADRPYATLAIAVGLGCLLGALWRR
jgi:ElaB/YqjD/DUF883 family membrane-anchored ribosome-binding protein